MHVKCTACVVQYRYTCLPQIFIRFSDSSNHVTWVHTRQLQHHLTASTELQSTQYGKPQGKTFAQVTIQTWTMSKHARKIKLHASHAKQPHAEHLKALWWSRICKLATCSSFNFLTLVLWHLQHSVFHVVNSTLLQIWWCLTLKS